ncbi:MAG TPA: hypothetical protein EYP14_02870, partial [Planctomycetaceae bacterium]|nr:hypothetical protein [Planctomycetaceae bacterium]
MFNDSRPRAAYSGLFSILVTALVNGSSAALLSAQDYLPGTEPSIGQIQHATQETIPANRDRTVIGIREWVTLSVDEDTWEDIDIETDEEGNEVGRVYDALGDVFWIACPWNGEFDPPVGTQTTFKVGYACFNDVEQIWAEAHDSGTMGLDPPAISHLFLEILVPDGNGPLSWHDWVLGTPGPPDESMGAQTAFLIQVLPDTVNFSRVTFKEIIGAQT